MILLSAPGLLVTALLVFALTQRYLRARFPTRNDTLIDTVDALLPQTQCAQCAYPGCRPYAEAIVGDGAPLNLCPPGGMQLHQQLTALMGNERAGTPPPRPANLVALIDEQTCIGCALCLPPCPVDAIVGAPGKIHTVVTQDCTGCELCLPACPVDCISLEAIAATVQQRRRKRRQRRTSPEPSQTTPHSPARGCIGCARCNPACPVELPVQALLQNVQQGASDRAVELGLMDCVECALCDQLCPSDIALADIFFQARSKRQQELDDAATRQRFKSRYAAHQQRLQDAEDAAVRRRSERLKRTRDASPWT